MDILGAIGGLVLHSMVARTSNEPHPNVGVGLNGTVGLLTYDKRDLHSSRFHAAVAVSGAGDVYGAVLNKRGDSTCTFVGVYDTFTGCLTLVGCGETFSNGL